VRDLVPDPWLVPGQDRAAAVLREACERGEVGHAWAFLGPPGVGQQQAARALAAALNCDPPSVEHPRQIRRESSTQPRPCGSCSACDRILRGAHPAYWELERTGAFHRVDDVRGAWLPAAYRTVGEGRVKVLRIVDADRMNETAANAFLKALEEPPEGTVWILDLADPDELPDTILSRCRTVRFAGWGPEHLRGEAARLGLEPGPDLELAVRACMGSPRTLWRLAGPGGLDALRRHRSLPRRLRDEGPGSALVAAKELDETVRRQVSTRRDEGRAALAQLAAAYGDEVPRPVAKQLEAQVTREEREAKISTLQAALDDLTGWLRDCLFVASGGDPADAIHRDAADALRDDAATLGHRRLLAAVDLVLAARESLEVNVQPQLAVESLLLSIHALGRD
jgi:DNA polymerase-3 subunit delta'